MIEERILETNNDPGAATTVDDLLTEGKAFIPDVKPEVEDNCIVFLPQRSMTKVRTTKENETNKSSSVVKDNSSENSSHTGNDLPSSKADTLSTSIHEGTLVCKCLTESEGTTLNKSAFHQCEATISRASQATIVKATLLLKQQPVLLGPRLQQLRPGMITSDLPQPQHFETNASLGLKSVFNPKEKQPEKDLSKHLGRQHRPLTLNALPKTQINFGNKDLVKAGITVTPMCLDCDLSFSSYTEAENHRKETHVKRSPSQRPSGPPIQHLSSKTSIQELPLSLPQPVQQLTIIYTPTVQPNTSSFPPRSKSASTLPVLIPKPQVNQFMPIVLQAAPIMQGMAKHEVDEKADTKKKYVVMKSLLNHEQCRSQLVGTVKDEN